MKTSSKFVAVAALALAGTAASAATQNFLLGTDVVGAQAAPTIIAKADGVIIATFQTITGVWVKHTLTPTTETRFGAFGEPVVALTDVIPNP